MLLVSSFFLIFFILFYTPLKFDIQIDYQKKWYIHLGIQYVWLHKVIDWSPKQQPQPSPMEQQFASIPISFSQLFTIGKKIWHHLKKKCFLQHCTIHCIAGCTRPDFTAYSYGLIWAILSMLPTSWQKWLTIDYQPNFQETMLQLSVKGIIYIPLGYLILILIYASALFSQEIWQQKRKEWREHENRLRRRLDGRSDGEYSSNGGSQYHYW